MSVNIVNVDGKCITRVMRNIADFLAKSCCKVESEGNEMEGEDVCGLGRSTPSPSEDGWGPSLQELQTMIETLKESHAQEIQNYRTEVTDTFVTLEVELRGECEELRKKVTELEVDATSLSEKVKSLEEENDTLEDVIGGLSSDILLNAREIENLKLLGTGGPRAPKVLGTAGEDVSDDDESEV